MILFSSFFFFSSWNLTRSCLSLRTDCMNWTSHSPPGKGPCICRSRQPSQRPPQVCLCVSTGMYIHVHVCTCVSKNMSMYTHVCIYVPCVHKHLCMSVCLHMCTCILSICLHVYTQVYELFPPISFPWPEEKN